MAVGHIASHSSSVVYQRGALINRESLNRIGVSNGASYNGPLKDHSPVL